MPRFFVKAEQINENEIEIIGEDIKHIKNVLRKRNGDSLEICNQDDGNSYICEIDNISDKSILTRIINQIKSEENNIVVDIYQGLPKADKMELIIQKSVELGVNAIIPVEMKRCVTKIDSKSEVKKIERWNKIAEGAAKQSGRNTVPEVTRLVKISDIIDRIALYDSVIVAYENEKEYKLKQEIKRLEENGKDKYRIAVVIGPEGGLEEQDVENLRSNGANVVTLGERILRTETVALNILSIIMYEFN